MHCCSRLKMFRRSNHAQTFCCFLGPRLQRDPNTMPHRLLCCHVGSSVSSIFQVPQHLSWKCLPVYTHTKPKHVTNWVHYLTHNLWSTTFNLKWATDVAHFVYRPTVPHSGSQTGHWILPAIVLQVQMLYKVSKLNIINNVDNRLNQRKS